MSTSINIDKLNAVRNRKKKNKVLTEEKKVLIAELIETVDDIDISTIVIRVNERFPDGPKLAFQNVYNYLNRLFEQATK